MNVTVCSTGAGAEEMVQPELRQAKTALIARRRQLRDEMKRVDEAIQSLERVIGTTPKPGGRPSVKRVVAEVLEEFGDVMHADEIVEAVKKRSVELSNRDPKATVVTALIRLRDAGEVEALGRNRWLWKGTTEDLMQALRVSVEAARREQRLEAGSATPARPRRNPLTITATDDANEEGGG